MQTGRQTVVMVVAGGIETCQSHDIYIYGTNKDFGLNFEVN